MIFIVCLFAGLVGAAFAANVAPTRSFGPTRNAALGLLGGTMAWIFLKYTFTLMPSLGTFLLILFCASGAAVLLITGLAILRNFRRNRRDKD